jgi:hypothetical protein
MSVFGEKTIDVGKGDGSSTEEIDLFAVSGDDETTIGADGE